MFVAIRLKENLTITSIEPTIDFDEGKIKKLKLKIYDKDLKRSF
jgi:hypothetical protein